LKEGRPIAVIILFIFIYNCILIITQTQYSDKYLHTDRKKADRKSSIQFHQRQTI